MAYWNAPGTARATRRRRRTFAMLVATGVLVVGAAGAADAKLTTGSCLVQKRKAWGNLRKCQVSEQVKQLKGKPADLAKCQTTFAGALAKITDKATKAGIACRYGDNGDRTVTDYDTGLQWEKKSGTFVINDGFLCLGGDPHCVNDTYTWDEASLFVDGSTDGTTLTSCFFGHCDWRLPTIVELQTILLGPAPCATSPCIDPIFGPTVARFHWSATTFATTTSNFAWAVDFDNGSVSYGAKDGDYPVRAVRAGL